MNNSTPTFEHLAEYLNYQYPATTGDIRLKALCEQIRKEHGISDVG
jgi:hypothetical protein